MRLLPSLRSIVMTVAFLSCLSPLQAAIDLAPPALGPSPGSAGKIAIAANGGRFLTVWLQANRTGAHVFGRFHGTDGKAIGATAFEVAGDTTPLARLYLFEHGTGFKLLWKTLETGQWWLGDVTPEGRLLQRTRLPIEDPFDSEVLWNGELFLMTPLQSYGLRALLLDANGNVLRTLTLSNRYGRWIVAGSDFVRVVSDYDTIGSKTLIERYGAGGLRGATTVRREIGPATAGSDGENVVIVWEDWPRGLSWFTVRSDGTATETGRMPAYWQSSGLKMEQILSVGSRFVAVVRRLSSGMSFDAVEFTIDPRGFVATSTIASGLLYGGSVAAAGAGDVATFAFHQGEPQGGRVFASIASSRLAAPPPPALLSFGGTHHEKPAIAGHDAGVTALWSRRDATSFHIETTAFAAGRPPAAPVRIDSAEVQGAPRDPHAIAAGVTESLAVWTSNGLRAWRMAHDGRLLDAASIRITGDLSQENVFAVEWIAGRYLAVWKGFNRSTKDGPVPAWWSAWIDPSGTVSAPQRLAIVLPVEQRSIGVPTSAQLASDGKRMVLAIGVRSERQCTVPPCPSSSSVIGFMLDPEGRLVPDSTTLLVSDASQFALASGPDRVYMAWLENDTVRGATVHPGADALNLGVRRTLFTRPAGAHGLDVAWSRDSFAVAIEHETNHRRVALLRVDRNGSPLPGISGVAIPGSASSIAIAGSPDGDPYLLVSQFISHDATVPRLLRGSELEALPPPPQAPAGVHAVRRLGHREQQILTVVWNEVVGAEAYVIEDPRNEVLTIVPAGKSSIDLDGKTTEVTVRAMNGGGASDPVRPDFTPSRRASTRRR